MAWPFILWIACVLLPVLAPAAIVLCCCERLNPLHPRADGDAVAAGFKKQIPFSCSDWYGPYEAGEQTDPRGRSGGDFRVFRDGPHSMLSRLVRSANRGAWIPESSGSIFGFRVVLGELPKGSILPPEPAPKNAQNVKQEVATIIVPPQDQPFFIGPQPFVKIPEGSSGPLFSRHNHSPAITECPNGDLLAVWFSTVLEGATELCNAASRLRFTDRDLLFEPCGHRYTVGQGMEGVQGEAGENPSTLV